MIFTNTKTIFRLSQYRKNTLLHSRLLQAFKFGIVGFVGLVVDFSVTWYFSEVLNFNFYLSNACGFVLAVVNNYVLNRVWTFNQASTNSISQFGLFLLIALAGLLLNSSVIFILTIDKKVEFIYAKFVATAIVFAWNFSMSSKFAFKAEDKQDCLSKDSASKNIH